MKATTKDRWAETLARKRALEQLRDSLDPLAADWPEGCCTGGLADDLPRLVAPGWCLDYGGAEVSNTIDPARAGELVEVRETPHPPGSAAARYLGLPGAGSK